MLNLLFLKTMYLYLAILQVKILTHHAYKHAQTIPHACVPCLPWLLIFTFYKQIAALVLTLKIRKVKIKAVNDSKEIAMMVYFTSIAAVEIFLLAVVLQGIHLAKVLSAAHIMGAATVIVVLTFVPKVLLQYTLKLCMRFSSIDTDVNINTDVFLDGLISLYRTLHYYNS